MFSPSFHLQQTSVREAVRRCFEAESTSSADLSDFQQRALDQLAHVKSAPAHSLAARVGTVTVKCLLMGRRRLESLCSLWVEFVRALRDCWEGAKELPLVEGDVDLSSCLLNQKLQMLQHCIRVKRRRHARLAGGLVLPGGPGPGSGAAEPALPAGESSSDIFYDASSGEAEPDSAAAPAHGRLQVLEGEFLLGRPDRPLCVPETQDRGPMTEDMVDERTRYLASLPDGDSRVRAQLDTLVSDMQAFKAANPGSQLEDFVRWHSPRDWVLDSDGNGESPRLPSTLAGILSDRMRIDGNIWREAWDSARPIPVSAQPRLFNEVKEVETVSNGPVQALLSCSTRSRRPPSASWWTCCVRWCSASRPGP